MFDGLKMQPPIHRHKAAQQQARTERKQFLFHEELEVRGERLDG
jgi:hypothetical protein